MNKKSKKKSSFKNSAVLLLLIGVGIGYAVISTTLNITGKTTIGKSSWDVHFENLVTTTGSVTPTQAAVIDSGKTNITYEIPLELPGDFYEFTVDVVNDGSIDAMIENVVKTPELTTEQAKYLKYEITYQNGESIATKQLLAKETTMPIKVRIEYRKDISNSDFPTASTTLDLSLTLEYIQSDGTGSSVTNNGMKIVNVVSGDGTQVGNEVCIKDECFYVISSNDTSVTMLAKYNLYVGGEYNNDTWTAYGDEATGKQDSAMLGFIESGQPYKGVTQLSDDTQKGTNYSDYSGSIVEGYVNNYNNYLITQGVTPIETRLITKDELVNLGCVEFNYCTAAPEWVYATSYWTGSAYSARRLNRVHSDGDFNRSYYYSNDKLGVRPVIIISKSNF